MEGELGALLLPFLSSADRTAPEVWGSGRADGHFEQGPGKRPRHQREAEACGHARKGHILCARAVVSKCRASADVEDGLASRARGNKELSPGLPVWAAPKPQLSGKAGIPAVALPVHGGSCPNAHVQIVFMTVLRRSDRAF